MITSILPPERKSFTVTTFDVLRARAVQNAKLDKSYHGHELWELEKDGSIVISITLRVWNEDGDYWFETTEL